jgi:hypothetical protein
VRVVSFGIQTEIWQTVEKEVEGHPHLETGEVGPETRVRSVAERDVRLRACP